MLLGNNTLILNQATMRTIVQEWLERNMVKCDSEVDFVTESSGSFHIKLIEKEEKD